MNLADVSKILINAFVDGWSSAPIAVGNEIKDTDPFWVRIDVKELASDQKTLGPKKRRKFQRDCAVFVQVFSPVEGAFRGIEGGKDAGRRLAEDVRRFFEGETIRPAKFIAANIGDQVKDEDSRGRWWLQLVTCSFYYFEVA